MRILWVKLLNYIGIYDGLGLNEIVIDFKKCKYRTVVIKGGNGSGKSTLFNALHPLPDDNSNFIQGLPAEKQIVIESYGIIYNIKISHGIKPNGNRETTKAYITRLNCGGSEEQLNPNGNVSSYKDILYSEFKLDPNFVSLSQLSSEDRGLVDKTPAKRKEFITNIIESLEVYNNIHKVLSKKSSIFRSMINSLVSKINNIGDEEKVKLSLASIENRLNKLFEEKDSLIQSLASFKSKIEILDPNCSIQNVYTSIYNDLLQLNKDIESNSLRIKTILTKIRATDQDNIIENYNNIKNNIIRLENDIHYKEMRINSLLMDRESEAKNIQLKTEKLNSLNSDSNYKEIQKALNLSNEKLKQYKQILDDIGIHDINRISKEEFILGLNTLKDIKEMVSTFKADIEHEALQVAIQFVLSDIYPDINSINTDISNISTNINNLELEYQRYSLLETTASKLNLRPNNCSIDSCEFIKDALEAFKLDPNKNMKIIEEQLKNSKDLLLQRTIERDTLNTVIEYINKLKVLVRIIQNNTIILDKLPIDNIFKDKQLFLDKVLNRYQFNEIDTLYSYINYSNIIDEYKSELSINNELNKEYNLYSSKNVIIEELCKDIEDFNIKLNKIVTEIDTNNNMLLENKKQLNINKTLILDYEVLIDLMNKENLYNQTKTELISKYNNIKTNMSVIKECLNNISITEDKLNTINKEITPIMKDRDTLKHGLGLLEEYNEELKIYNLKYEKVEVIKEHSSPTKGIQTLYMEIYMNKTLQIANELLGLLFDGNLVLHQYEINESEFRIPITSNRILHDDISSLSTAQKCMVSMILSFALLQQSSSKYNILKLDEIDSGLDGVNRRVFLNVLAQMSNILNIEQTIMISHNQELDLNNCDLVLLNMNGLEIPSEGNIIYSYN